MLLKSSVAAFVSPLLLFITSGPPARSTGLGSNMTSDSKYLANNLLVDSGALDFCERITRDDLEVAEDCFARPQEHFAPAEIVVRTFIVGYQPSRVNLRRHLAQPRKASQRETATRWSVRRATSPSRKW
jgi:hypothetical protein